MPLKCLLLSNSTAAGKPYLELWSSTISTFLIENKVTKILFIPFAGVTIHWDDYTGRVSNALTSFQVTGIHKEPDMKSAVNAAESIMIGGGNTFNLLFNLQKYDLIDIIASRVKNDGIPYVGWSAGSNVATPNISTTNDMPVIWPSSDVGLGLVKFNINPHYNEWSPPNMKGETRIDRLNEAITVRKNTIVGLSEGLAIRTSGPLQHYIVKSPLQLRPPNTPVMVKVWTVTADDGFKITEIPLGTDDEQIQLDPYLQ